MLTKKLGCVYPVFSSSVPIMCTELGPGLSKLVGWSPNVGTDLLVLRTLPKMWGQSIWPCSSAATFCKAVLYYCSQDGFPCRRMTSHGIRGIPHPFNFCGNIPSVFCNKECTTHLCDNHFIHYMMPWSNGFMFLVETGSTQKRCTHLRTVPTLWAAHWPISRENSCSGKPFTS